MLELWLSFVDGEHEAAEAAHNGQFMVLGKNYLHRGHQVVIVIWSYHLLQTYGSTYLCEKIVWFLFYKYSFYLFWKLK